MKKILSVILSAAMAVSLVACGGTKITEMSVEPEVTLEKGGEYQLEAIFKASKELDEAKMAEATATLELEFVSSNEEVATVDEGGLVTAVDVGEAEITVSVKDQELSATCKVTVENPVKDIEVPEELEFTVGDEAKKIEAKVIPEDAVDYEIQYESSDEKIATVDEDGNVTPVAEGECIIKTTAVVPTVVGEADNDNAAESKVASEASESEVAESEAVDSAPAEKNIVEETEILATGETKIIVKAQEKKTGLVNAEKAADKNVKNDGGAKSTAANNTAATTTTTNTSAAPVAPVATPTPAAPAAPVNPAPVPAPAPVNPAPAPAPDPVPEVPAPAPEAPAPEPEQPSDGMVSGDGAGVGKDGDLIIEGGGISEGDGADAVPAPDWFDD